MQLARRLEDMHGKEFFYNQERHKVVNTRFFNGEIEIVTEKKWLKVTAVQLQLFTPVPPDTNGVMVYEDTGRLKALTDKLMVALEKVENDKSYIAQAQAISKIAQSYIGVGMMQLKAFALINNLKKR